MAIRSSVLTVWLAGTCAAACGGPAAVAESGPLVGSTYGALAAAYPGIAITNLPEWFDARATCIATSRALPNVQFLLASCGTGGNGDVIRIVVSRG